MAEAACELFLEQGYAATSVADIALRAGVSRSSFFNYFSSKSDVIWGGFDTRAQSARDAIAGSADPIGALRGIAVGFAPDSLALAITHADAMGLTHDLDAERALRQALLGRAVSDRLVAQGRSRLVADVRGAAAGGAVLAAVWAWSAAGPARAEMGSFLDDALAIADPKGETRGPVAPGSADRIGGSWRLSAHSAIG
ncbi:TetR/AcrR family transcriptional regulator [Microbacterium memoriense]|uniref:TetR/AcrR family transcriptional regulator n=1 Tax=Microbacterium memoriense TaxID=2978350 RepID=A0ABT2PAB9_9MICO|nr:TetR/AcrR family transcriptional regulator [Microbacterium memoriense]MCT9001549.1 TetR/AcrR family transcriptional regulator [Microbacterium memoriense]